MKRNLFNKNGGYFDFFSLVALSTKNFTLFVVER